MKKKEGGKNRNSENRRRKRGEKAGEKGRKKVSDKASHRISFFVRYGKRCHLGNLGASPTEIRMLRLGKNAIWWLQNTFSNT